MAFFRLILKANKLEEARELYHNEKLQSIEMSEGIKPHYTLSQKYRMQKIMLKKKIIKFIRKIICWREDFWFYRIITLIKTNGTFENFIFKSIIGFFGGVLLTYIFFFFFIFHLKFTLFTATMFCSLFGIFFTMGLAFSHHIRCIVFLLLPQFFSKRGRQVLMAYAFILVFTGPTKNTLQNVEVLSETLTCGQKELKGALSAINDLIKQPFHALRESLTKVLKSMKEIVQKIEKTMLSIRRIILTMLKVIESVFKWLGSIVNICNKKIGTPFERCQHVFEGAVVDCLAKLGPLFGGLCNLTYLVSSFCYVVKPLDFICVLISYSSDAIVYTIRRNMKKFSNHVKTIFYVQVNFTQSYHFETNQSKSFEKIAMDITKEIRSKADSFNQMFDWMSLLMSFFFFYMFLRVLRYHHKWLTSDRYDNKYLTGYFRDIDLMRVKTDKETVLPLNRRERKTYIPLTSIRLIADERNKLFRSIFFLGLITLKICILIAVDYSLYWVLSLIRYYGGFQTNVQQANSVGVHVSGTGYLAELYRSIANSFSPEDSTQRINTVPCLPDPMPPDYDRYVEIGMLIISCWFMVVVQPYALRIRQIVMSSYYPGRAKQRSVYLYNQILRRRGSFLKFARRQLRRKYGIAKEEDIERVTCKERLFALCPKLNICFPQNNKFCLLCGAVEREGNAQHIKCPTPRCVGLFCIECFADLQNICTICQSPLQYGDFSDISEEKDSSDDKDDDSQLNRNNNPHEQRRRRKRTQRNVVNDSLRGGADGGFDRSRDYDLSENTMSQSTDELLGIELEDMTIYKTPKKMSSWKSRNYEKIRRSYKSLLKRKIFEKHQSHELPETFGDKLMKTKRQSSSTSMFNKYFLNDMTGEIQEEFNRNPEMDKCHWHVHGEAGECDREHKSDSTNRKWFIGINTLSHETSQYYEINERNRAEFKPAVDTQQRTSSSSSPISSYRSKN